MLMARCSKHTSSSNNSFGSLQNVSGDLDDLTVEIAESSQKSKKHSKRKVCYRRFTYAAHEYEDS